MPNTVLKRWNGTAFEELYPKTTTSQIVASGTPSGTTFLRGDGQWAVPAGVDNYVNITGDTMTGALTVNNNLFANRYYQNANGVPTGNLGNPTVTEMALFDEQFYNQTAFYDISRLKFYSSTDGTTWTEITTITDGQKRTLVGGDNGGGVTIPNLTPYYRIEITNNGNYVFLNALYLYMTTSSHATSVKIKARRRSDLTFVNFATSSSTVNLWPGHVYLPFSTIPYLTGGSSSGHYDIVHIDFQPIWSGDPTYGTQPIFIQKLQIWGGYPAGKRNVFSTDENANVAFPAALTGTRLISTIATGTSPLAVTSTTAVTNLNADLLDGLHSSAFAAAVHTHDVLSERGTITYGLSGLQWNDTSGVGGTGLNGAAPNNPTNEWWHHLIMNHGNAAGYYVDIAAAFNTDDLYLRRNVGGTLSTWRKIWNEGNDGAASGLDADLVDGLHSSSLVQTTGDQSISGTKTFTGNVNISGTLDLTNAGVIGALDLSNNSIIGVNNIVITDPGPSEGIQWAGGNAWAIYESPNDLTTNSGGNLQIVQNTTRRGTFNTSGQLEIPVSTGTAPFVITSNTAVTNLNADRVDSLHTSEIMSLGSQSDFADGTLVVTSLDAAASTGPSWTIEVIGKGYGLNPIFFIAEGYNYNDTFINTGGYNYGTSAITSIKVLNYNNNVAFWWPRLTYWNSFDVKVTATETVGLRANKVTSITNATEPVASKKVTITLIQAVNSSNIASQNVATATTLQTARTINGVSFNGSANITVTAAPNAHTHAIADVTNLQTSLDAKINTSARNAANGVAPLDATSKVPVANLPDFITGAGRGFYLVGTISGAVSLSAASTGLVAQLVALSGGDYENMYGYMWTAAAEVTLTWTDQTTLGPVYQYHVLTPGDEGDSTSPVTLEAGDMIVFTKYSNVAGNGDDQEFTFSVINSSDPRFANYLPLSGGTMTNNILFANNVDKGITNAAGTALFYLDDQYGNTYIKSDDGVYLQGNTFYYRNQSAVYRFYVNGTSGNVGIGTTTPTHLLQVNGSNGILSTFSGASSSIQLGADGNGGVIRPQTVDRLNFTQANGTNVMTINGANVGIGTASPVAKLDVAGGARIVGVVNIVGDGGVKRLAMDFDDALDAATIFAIQDGVAYKNLILQGSGGNVGIATTTPSEKLEVVGNAKATRFISTQATGTAPLTVASTTAVTNLNADLLDGNHASAFLLTSAVKEQLKYLYVYGKAQSAITKGQAVQFAGVQGDHILIKAAVPSEINTNPDYFVGLAEATLATNDFGYVLTQGELTNVNTNAYTEGAILWFASAGSTAGALTATEPTGTNAKIQVGAVTKVNATEGIILTRMHIFGVQIADIAASGTPSNSTFLRGDGTWSSVTASNVGLGNVTNESKVTMFTNAALTSTPTAPTATAGTNTTQIATTAFVSTAVANLINSAPGALDTLDELAAALGDDANFASTVTNSLALKANDNAVVKLTSDQTIAGVKTFSSDIYAPRFIANPSSGGNDTSGAWGIADYDDKLSAVRDYITDTYYPIYHTGNKPTATDVGLGNVTNESKATMFTSPTFTGTVSGVTAAMVGAAATSHTHAIADVTNLQTSLDAKLSLAGGTIDLNTGTTSRSITFNTAQSFTGPYLRGSVQNLQRGYYTDQYTIWDAGNDGAGSGLDADTVDGIQASSFALAITKYKATGTSSTSGVTTRTAVTTITLLANKYYHLDVTGMYSKTSTSGSTAPVINIAVDNTTGTPTINGRFEWLNGSAATAYTVSNTNGAITTSDSARGFTAATATLSAITTTPWGLKALFYTGTSNKILTFYISSSSAVSGTCAVDMISIRAEEVAA